MVMLTGNENVKIGCHIVVKIEWIYMKHEIIVGQFHVMSNITSPAKMRNSCNICLPVTCMSFTQDWNVLQSSLLIRKLLLVEQF